MFPLDEATTVTLSSLLIRTSESSDRKGYCVMLGAQCDSNRTAKELLSNKFSNYL